MTKQITLKELLEIVSVVQTSDGSWHIVDVKGNVLGNVKGNVEGNVDGYVGGKINGREWEYVETPKDKLERLINETGSEELIEAFNQLEDN